MAIRRPAWFYPWPKHSGPTLALLVAGVALMFVGKIAADVIGLIILIATGTVLICLCARQRGKRRIPQVAAASALMMASVVFAAYQTWYDVYPPKPSAPGPSPKSPMLVARCKITTLPIALRPGAVIYVVGLAPSLKEWVWEQKNDSDAQVTWPRDYDAHPPDMVQRCDLTNNADKALLDLAMSAITAFYELHYFSGSAPPGREVVFTHTPSGRAFTYGDKVTSFDRKIVVAAVPARETVTLYFINQSRFLVKVSPPKSGLAIVDGTPLEVVVRMLRPRVTVFDVIPDFWQEPPRYRWKGIPDAPQNPQDSTSSGRGR